MQFLNISNHPSDKWSHEQMEAARALGGEPSDVKFPHVAPTWETAFIEMKAGTIVERLDLTGGVKAAMVAGEPVMALAIVRELQARGVACYSATTERVVVESEGGVKTSLFTFVQFRKWPSL